MCSLKRDITSTIIHDAVHRGKTFPGITLNDMSFKEKQNNNKMKSKKKKKENISTYVMRSRCSDDRVKAYLRKDRLSNHKNETCYVVNLCNVVTW